MNVFPARVQYEDVVCPPRTSFVKRADKGDSKAVRGKCGNCNRVFLYFPPASFERVIELACSLKCEKELKWRNPAIHEKPIVVEKNTKPPQCPDCGGPSVKGPGWKHNDGCPRVPHKKTAKPERCPECGGLSSQGRGFSHQPGCQNTAAARAAKRYAEKRAQSRKSLSPQEKEFYENMKGIDPVAAAKWLQDRQPK